MRLTRNMNVLKSWLSKPVYLPAFRFQPHPAVQLYAWICLALAVHSVSDDMLVLITGLIVIWAYRVNSAHFFSILRRTRLILLSVLLIYGYATPGGILWPQLGLFSPTGHGVIEGMHQIFRLLTVMAALSVLFAGLSQAQLMSGVYFLLYPLGFIGLPRERVAARLALTLKYAEEAMRAREDSWRVTVEKLMLPAAVESRSVELQLDVFTRVDLLLVIAVSATLAGLWL